MYESYQKVEYFIFLSPKFVSIIKGLIWVSWFWHVSKNGNMSITYFVLYCAKGSCLTHCAKLVQWNILLWVRLALVAFKNFPKFFFKKKKKKKKVKDGMIIEVIVKDFNYCGVKLFECLISRIMVQISHS